jgi:hydroxymethylglutaryl-CoA lyase
VPNRRGAERAIAAGVDLVVAFISASPEYSERNQNMTIADAMSQLEGVARVARANGVGWAAGVSMAFGSPYEDEIPPEHVFALVARCARLGAEHVYVADTIGVAWPAQVRAMCDAIRARLPELTLAVHLHGSGARGLANAVAAVHAGAAQVETSIRGLGGPVVRSRGAAVVGNLPTEDVVAAFAALGIDTGLDPDTVRAAARDVGALLGLAPVLAGGPPAASEIAAMAGLTEEAVG